MNADSELEALKSLMRVNSRLTIKDALTSLETYNNDVFEKIHNQLDVLIAKNLIHSIKWSK